MPTFTLQNTSPEWRFFRNEVVLDEATTNAFISDPNSIAKYGLREYGLSTLPVPGIILELDLDGLKKDIRDPTAIRRLVADPARQITTDVTSLVLDYGDVQDYLGHPSAVHALVPENKVTTAVKALHLAGTKLADNRTPLSNIAALGKTTSLKKLDLFNTGVQDISALANLHELEMLILADTKVNNLEPLTSLTKMKKRDLSGL